MLIKTAFTVFDWTTEIFVQFKITYLYNYVWIMHQYFSVTWSFIFRGFWFDFKSIESKSWRELHRYSFEFIQYLWKSLIFIKAAFIWSNQQYCEILLQFQINVPYCNILYIVIHSCDAQLYFQHHYSSLQCHMIFRNHNNMLIYCSKNISDYYQCWKRYAAEIFRENCDF